MQRDFDMLKPRTTLTLALPILVALGLLGCAFYPVLDKELVILRA